MMLVKMGEVHKDDKHAEIIPHTPTTILSP